MSTGIGLRIKNRRNELGLSQEELAFRMGLKSKSTICKVECGEDNLTSDRVRKYANALETTPAYITGWEETDAPDSGKTEKAIELYDRIMSLPPVDQTAILTLLDSLQKKP